MKLQQPSLIFSLSPSLEKFKKEIAAFSLQKQYLKNCQKNKKYPGIEWKLQPLRNSRSSKLSRKKSNGQAAPRSKYDPIPETDGSYFGEPLCGIFKALKSIEDLPANQQKKKSSLKVALHMLAHDPRLTEKQVQEHYQLLHSDAQCGYSKHGELHWSALKASEVTGNPYTNVTRQGNKTQPPFNPVQLYFKTCAKFWHRHAETLLGFFWDFFGILHVCWNILIYSVSLRRFWILLLRALVTHTYNTYERLFRHGDVNICIFLLPCDCFGPTCVSPKSSQNHPNFFGMTPICLGLVPNDPRNFGGFWDVLGRSPNHPRKFGFFWVFFGVTLELLGFSCENPKWRLFFYSETSDIKMHDSDTRLSLNQEVLGSRPEVDAGCALVVWPGDVVPEQTRLW